MKLIFLGTPQIAVKTLQMLALHFDIVCVVTATDKPVGRSGALEPSPVSEKALSLGLNCIKPDKLDHNVVTYLKSLDADYFVTFAYGKIFKPEFLTIAKSGGINIHPSLLPEYRGASPMQQAIADGKTMSGITVQKIVLEVDSGDVLDTVHFDIKEDDDIISIEKLVSELASVLIVKVLNAMQISDMSGVKQDDSKAVYCRKIEKSDGVIDWTNSASVISNTIRAYTSWPVCSTVVDGKKLNIVKASVIKLEDTVNAKPGTVLYADKRHGVIVQCGDLSALKIVRLQMQGKNILDAKDFINGFRDLQGRVLG